MYQCIYYQQCLLNIETEIITKVTPFLPFLAINFQHYLPFNLIEKGLDNTKCKIRTCSVASLVCGIGYYYSSPLALFALKGLQLLLHLQYTNPFLLILSGLLTISSKKRIYILFSSIIIQDSMSPAGDNFLKRRNDGDDDADDGSDDDDALIDQQLKLSRQPQMDIESISQILPYFYIIRYIYLTFKVKIKASIVRSFLLNKPFEFGSRTEQILIFFSQTQKN